MKNKFLAVLLLLVMSTLSVAKASPIEETAQPEVTEQLTEEVQIDEAEKKAETEPSPELEEKYSVTMAINNTRMMYKNHTTWITAPVLVFDKVYVELLEMAPILGYDVAWIVDGIGYFKITGNGKDAYFTSISEYTELKKLSNKFFLKEGKVYVPLGTLTGMMDIPFGYIDGIVSLGEENAEAAATYSSVNAYPTDDHVYLNYPRWASHVVNPYAVYSYETMISDAEKLQLMYPELIKTTTIGKSVEGRDLLLIEFGRGERKIFVCGTHHAREYIATTYLMNAIDKYAYAYRTNSMWGAYNPKAILDSVTFCIVPMVNPDGVNLVQNGIGATPNASEISNMGIYDGKKYGYRAWKANIRGVDVNWNYDKDWDITKNKNGRGSTGFNGDFAGSEPETIAISNYVDSYPFEAFLSMHTQGEIFYWADNPQNPSGINTAIARDTGFSGHKEVPTGRGGSFFDYVYRKYMKPTVTIELCPYVGSFPYPDSDFNTVWAPSKNIMLVLANTILNMK